MHSFAALKAKFPDLEPISGPPPLFRLNGCGFTVLGTRDRDPETATYLTTYTFTVVFLPVLALRAYRVADAPGGGQYYYGREGLSGLARGWNWLLAAGAVFFCVLVAIGASVSDDRARAPRSAASGAPVSESRTPAAPASSTAPR